jgi:hypothetical protein
LGNEIKKREINIEEEKEKQRELETTQKKE